MRLPSFRSEPGFWVSAGTHVGLLVFALFSVAAPALPEAQEGVPVEVITENQFSELTKGERNAEKPLSDAKPRADKKAEKFEEKEPENAKVDSPTAPTRTSDMKLANADEMPLRVNEPDPAAEGDVPVRLEPRLRLEPGLAAQRPQQTGRERDGRAGHPGGHRAHPRGQHPRGKPFAAGHPEGELDALAGPAGGVVAQQPLPDDE